MFCPFFSPSEVTTCACVRVFEPLLEAIKETEWAKHHYRSRCPSICAYHSFTLSSLFFTKTHNVPHVFTKMLTIQAGWQRENVEMTVKKKRRNNVMLQKMRKRQKGEQNDKGQRSTTKSQILWERNVIGISLQRKT